MKKAKRPRKLKWREIRYLNQLVFQTDVRKIPWKAETFQSSIPIRDWNTDIIFQEVTV